MAPIPVHVANGHHLICQTEFVDMAWTVQSCTFTSTLKVLPLQHYDMIVGMEWLERFSPMQIHWSLKWMLLPYKLGGSMEQSRVQGRLAWLKL